MATMPVPNRYDSSLRRSAVRRIGWDVSARVQHLERHADRERQVGEVSVGRAPEALKSMPPSVPS